MYADSCVLKTMATPLPRFKINCIPIVTFARPSSASRASKEVGLARAQAKRRV